MPSHGSRNLEQPDFDVLLRRFDSDCERSKEKFQSLRWRLTKFFEWNGCFSASEDLADLTMDTVARKPPEFVIDEIVAYCYSVARNILKEFHRRTSREIHLADPPEGNGSAQDFEQGLISDIDLRKRVKWLNHCLHKLRIEDRDLVLEYYSAEGPTHIVRRQELARTFGVSMNALWVRVNRIRNKLEDCLEKELGKAREVRKTQMGSFHSK